MHGKNDEVKHFQVGTMKVEVHPDPKSMGAAAARATAEGLKESGRTREIIGIIFATGASQLDTLEALTRIEDFHGIAFAAFTWMSTSVCRQVTLRLSAATCERS